MVIWVGATAIVNISAAWWTRHLPMRSRIRLSPILVLLVVASAVVQRRPRCAASNIEYTFESPTYRVRNEFLYRVGLLS